MKEKFQREEKRGNLDEDLDKEFGHLYKMQRPLEKDEIEANNMVKALEVFNNKVDYHPERKVKKQFDKFVEEKLDEYQKDHPGLKFR